MKALPNGMFVSECSEDCDKLGSCAECIHMRVNLEDAVNCHTPIILEGLLDYMAGAV